MKLTWDVTPRADLHESDRDALYAVATRVYSDVARATFESDLAEKDFVIRLRDESEALRGFSTLRFYPSHLGDQAVDVLFSGDTAIDPEAWGTPALPHAWLWTALRHRAQSDRPLWWLLLAGGYRTYRYMTVFFDRGWPRHDTPLPPELGAFRDRLARERYGARYRDGIVHLEGAPLREELAAPGELRARVDPHVAWYFAANPGHVRGDELVCLTEIDPTNLTDAGRRILRAVT